MLGSGVFKANETLGGRNVTLISRAFPIVLLHNLIEVTCSVFLTFGDYLLEKLSELLLELKSLCLYFLVPLSNPRSSYFFSDVISWKLGAQLCFLDFGFFWLRSRFLLNCFAQRLGQCLCHISGYLRLFGWFGLLKL